jgi:hypothetical protein
MKLFAFNDNVKINPRNINDFGFVKDFRNPRSRVSLDFDNVVLVNEDYNRVINWVYNEYGRHENIPLTIIADDGQSYPHYLDLSELKYGTNELECGIQARKGTDHFFDKAENTTFELMYQNGGLVDSDFKKTPFLIVPNDLNLQRVVNLMFVLSVTQQVVTLVFEGEKLIADGLDVVGTGVLTTIGKIIAFALHLIITIINFIALGINIRTLYFPKLRYFKACSDYTLIKKGCEYLGYSLNSNALLSLANIHTLPIPQSTSQSIFQTLFNDLGDLFNNGYPTASDSTPTIYSLIESYLDLYNLKIFVYDSVVTIERRDYFMQNASLTIGKTFAVQDKRSYSKTFNNSEVWGRKVLSYQIDSTDVHTSDIDYRIQAEYITQPISTLNADLVNLKGLKEIRVPFSLGDRKNSYNAIEEYALSLFLNIDALINAFGGNSNLASVVTNRLGVLVIADQFFQNTKRLYLGSDNKQPSNYLDLLNIDQIYIDYHQDLEVANNCVVFEKFEIPFTQAKFASLLQNNFVILEDGDIVEAVSIGWKDRKAKATIEIASSDESSFNVKTIKLT